MMARLSLQRFMHCLLAAALASHSSAMAVERPVEQWLRGTGEDLELCLHGQVVEADGTPASGFSLSGQLNTRIVDLPFEPVIDGSHFKVWIPVNRSRLYSLAINAKSADRKRVAHRSINAYDLRQLAQEGVTFTLQRPSRVVEVKVVHEGEPVAGAQVKAEVGYRNEVLSTTDTSGIAEIRLLANQELDRLTAWTDDYRVGGFSFNRKPVRDPAANSHTVELSDCRDITLRCIDESGESIPDVDCMLQVATPPPNYNYIGTTEHSVLTTDKQGEAQFKWFPDWPKHHFYVELQSSGWVLDGDLETIDDVAVCKLKRAKPRKTIQGSVASTVTGNAGFYVALQSFQGEQENHSDVLRTFSDADGNFSFDVLPDATYCAFVVDSEFVGESVDLIPYDSASEQVTNPRLSVLPGQKVEVLVTSGAKKQPYPNLTLSLRKEHNYQWQEDGETRYGSGGPSWWIKTDEHGRAITRTLPGKLEVSAYTPSWRMNREVEIVEDEPTTVRIHRTIVERRTFHGRLVASDSSEVSLENARIEVGAIDSEYKDRQSLQADAAGKFSFEFMAEKIAIFAYTQDGQASGQLVIPGDEVEPLEITLHPTQEFFGFLVDKKNNPLPNTNVSARVRITGDDNWESIMTIEFDENRLTTKSDGFGSYALNGVPTDVDVMVYAESDDKNSPRFVEKIHLKSSE